MLIFRATVWFWWILVGRYGTECHEVKNKNMQYLWKRKTGGPGSIDISHHAAGCMDRHTDGRKDRRFDSLMDGLMYG